MAWTRKILRVNLTAGTCTPEPLNMEWANLYLGQRGLATKYLAEEIDPRVDALSPDNKLIMWLIQSFDRAVPMAELETAVPSRFISIYRKMHVLQPAADRAFVIQSAGNLATTQEVLDRINRDLDADDGRDRFPDPLFLMRTTFKKRRASLRFPR